MNSLKCQDIKLIYRNLLPFCTLTANYQKEKLRKQSHLQLHQKEKNIQEYDFYSENYKTVKKLKMTQTNGEMYVFMDWKN